MIVFISLLNSNSDIQLFKIHEIDIQKPVKGDYWHMVDESRLDYLKLYDIDPLDYDFNEYNIVISEGREILEMEYKREKSFPFRKTKYTKTILKRDFFPNKVFIYKIDKKTKVYLDERGLSMDIAVEK